MFDKLWNGIKLRSSNLVERGLGSWRVIEMTFGQNSDKVNTTTMLGVAAYQAALDLIDSRMAEVEFKVGTVNDEGEFTPAMAHPVQTLLDNGITEWMDSDGMQRLAAIHIKTAGNFYADIKHATNGRITGLVPYLPGRVKPEVKDDKIVYKVTEKNGATVDKNFEDVFHVKGFSLDGIVGVPPIMAGELSLALGISATEYGRNFFKNDARPSVAMLLDDQLSMGITDERIDKMKRDFEAKHGDTKNRGAAVLAGVKNILTLSANPDDSQFLEVRQEFVRDIGRMFGVPSILLDDTARSTYNNWREAQRSFIANTITKIANTIAKGITKQLLTDINGNYVCVWEFKGLQLDTQKERFDSYSIATGRKQFFTVNEVRAMEDKEPIEGGDTLSTMAVNPLQQMLESQPEEQAQDNEEDS